MGEHRVGVDKGVSNVSQALPACDDDDTEEAVREGLGARTDELPGPGEMERHSGGRFGTRRGMVRLIRDVLAR